jgi:hypothetical protein
MGLPPGTSAGHLQSPEVPQTTNHPVTQCPLATLLDSFPDPSNPHTHIDDISWGDPIEIDPLDYLRLCFQDVDGLRHDSDKMDLLYVANMAQFQVGIF